MVMIEHTSRYRTFHLACLQNKMVITFSGQFHPEGILEDSKATREHSIKQGYAKSVLVGEGCMEW